MPNLLNPANDPIIDARLRKGLLNFGTAFATGGPGIPGDIGQGAVSGLTGLLNSRMNTIDPSGQVRAMSGQFGLLDAPEVPFSSEAMQKKLGGDPSAPESLLGFIGAPDPSDVGKIVSAAIAKGLLDPSLAQALFHGTPHKFDKFDLKAIGSGEGAQAYGHGLYFAEDPGVAGSYKTNISDMSKAIKFDGNTYTFSELLDTGDALLDNVEAAGFSREAAEGAMSALGSAKGSVSKAKKALTNIPDNMRPYIKGDVLDEQLRILDRFESTELKGHLYEVDIPDETIGKMLDWDAPLSEQPENVQAYLRNLDSSGLETQGMQRKFDEMDLLANNDQRLYNLWQDGEGDLAQVAVRVAKDEGSPSDIARINREFREFKFDSPDFMTELEKSSGTSTGDILRAAGIGSPEHGARISKEIQDFGYPGIKYESGQLSGGPGGSRDIVVFNPDDITQVKRDGELVHKTGLLGDNALKADEG